MVWGLSFHPGSREWYVYRRRVRWVISKWYPTHPVVGRIACIMIKSNSLVNPKALRSWHFVLFPGEDCDWCAHGHKNVFFYCKVGRMGRCVFRGVGFVALLVLDFWWLQVISSYVDDHRTSNNNGCSVGEGIHGHGWSLYHQYYFATLIDSRADDCDLVRVLAG